MIGLPGEEEKGRPKGAGKYAPLSGFEKEQRGYKERDDENMTETTGRILENITLQKHITL